MTSPGASPSDLVALLPRLRRFARVLTRDGPDADDLVQEGCTAALAKWSRRDPAVPLDRWMFTILRNAWISEMRKRRVRQGQGQIPAEGAAELVAAGTPDDLLLAVQVRGRVEALPPDLSLPLLLVSSEGHTYREVADLLDLPIGTVMSRIHRARRVIAAGLGEAAT